MNLNKLFTIILNRQENMPKNSYTVLLFRKGLDGILKKIGEESTELVIAAKNRSKKDIIAETADLWFHILLLLALINLSPKDIMKELERRNNTKI